MLGAFVLAAASAHAHHSFAGVYDASRRLTLEGIVAAIEFVNPHPFVVLDVADSAGSVERWRLEMDNRWELLDIGFASDTVRPGDRVVVTGSPARNRRGLYLRRLDRPSDGFWYEQAGSSPRIGFGAN
jgi:hypothetical protein